MIIYRLQAIGKVPARTYIYQLLRFKCSEFWEKTALNSLAQTSEARAIVYFHTFILPIWYKYITSVAKKNKVKLKIEKQVIPWKGLYELLICKL